MQIDGASGISVSSAKRKDRASVDVLGGGKPHNHKCSSNKRRKGVSHDTTLASTIEPVGRSIYKEAQRDHCARSRFAVGSFVAGQMEIAEQSGLPDDERCRQQVMNVDDLHRQLDEDFARTWQAAAMCGIVFADWMWKSGRGRMVQNLIPVQP